ncbi:hypothetical protein ABTC98_07690 [Acinetobacter baumannii]
MKAGEFLKVHGLKLAKEVVEGAPDWARYYSTIDGEYYLIELGAVFLPDQERLVESLDRYCKFEVKQEALNAITNAPDGSTHYRKLSCGTRYIKQGPRFFEYWNGSEWYRPTVPFTDETHILRFDKLEDLKQSIKDHESIYGGGHV